MPPATQSQLVSPISPSLTPTPTQEKKSFPWRPKLPRNGNSSNSGLTGNHRVTFSKDSFSDKEKDGYSSASHSESSRPPSPGHNTPNGHLTPLAEPQKRPWQKIDRSIEATWQPPAPPSPPPIDNPRPFLVYNDSFLSILGSSPSLTTLISDARAPFFYNSGIFCSRTSTLFLTSCPVPDSNPSAAPSRNLTTTISKVDFHSPSEWSRDKVRTPEHAYMPLAGCSYKSGLVLAAQGSLAEPAALIFMDAKRPHRTTPLLTNFNGERLNSPHSVASHADGSLWFTDPHLNWKGEGPGFRPRPRLPPLVYRFNLENGDLRPVASDLPNPTSLAFGPDYRTLYILDLPFHQVTQQQHHMPNQQQQQQQQQQQTNGLSNGHSNGNSNGYNGYSNGNNGTMNPSLALAQVFAYTSMPVGPMSSHFLTNKRLFCVPMNDPTCLTTDLFGNVYIGCSNGVHVFDVGGTMVGRIVTASPVTGVCFGRSGELWISLGNELVKAKLGRDIRAGALSI